MKQWIKGTVEEEVCRIVEKRMGPPSQWWAFLWKAEELIARMNELIQQQKGLRKQTID